MKSFFVSGILSLLVISLVSCEVFKTTPRSSPDYRGPGSKSNASVQRNSTRNTERPTLIGRKGEKKSKPKTSARKAPPKRTAANTGRSHHSNARTTTANSRGNTSANRNSSATRPNTVKKELSARPAGIYDANVPEVVQIARTYTGTPYRSGGNDKAGIDCSGLICQVYTEMGVKVPRISWQQSEFGKEVDQIMDIKPGDWIFFVPEGGKEGYVSHSGIVTEVRGEKDIVFIHASSSRGVVEDNLFSNYFRNRFVKAIRPF